MKKTLIIFLSIFIVSIFVMGVAKLSIEGYWDGTISFQGTELRLLVKIKKDAKGGYTATMDSLDQGATDIPITKVEIKDGKLILTVDAVNGGYEGTINKNYTKITGTWSQNGNSLPLDLVKQKKEKPKK